MSALTQLQHWYFDQCDDDWEHSYGVTIDTLDNPGWRLEIDLADTDLAGKAFDPIHYGMFADAESSGIDWMHCKVENSKFMAVGGPLKLDEIIHVFLKWAAT